MQLTVRPVFILDPYNSRRIILLAGLSASYVKRASSMKVIRVVTRRRQVPFERQPNGRTWTFIFHEGQRTNYALGRFCVSI